jgi:hypothetical protein
LLESSEDLASFAQILSSRDPVHVDNDYNVERTWPLPHVAEQAKKSGSLGKLAGFRRVSVINIGVWRAGERPSLALGERWKFVHLARYRVPISLDQA